jgi:hypothetical protein
MKFVRAPFNNNGHKVSVVESPARPWSYGSPIHGCRLRRNKPHAKAVVVMTTCALVWARNPILPGVFKLLNIQLNNIQNHQRNLTTMICIYRRNLSRVRLYIHTQSVYVYTNIYLFIYLCIVFQKELYNFEILYKFIQRTCVVFSTVIM